MVKAAFLRYNDGKFKKYPSIMTRYIRLGLASIILSIFFAQSFVSAAVLPDFVSPFLSRVSSGKSVVRTGAYDFATVRVVVNTVAGLPVPRHTIALQSSRDHDLIRPLRAGVTMTNEYGEVSFAVTSSLDGLSRYTAYDLTEGLAVGQPVSILYDSASSLGAGGDPDTIVAQVVTQSTAFGFEFEQMPTSVKVNQPADFTVAVYDTNHSPVINYTGTIHFTALGDNGLYASLPKDYKFTGTDLGKHTFPLAMQFQQEGVFQLEVRDTVKPTLVGTSVVVVQGGGIVATGAVAITSPSPGTYSSGVQTVSGTATAGKDVKIYDGTTELGVAVAGLTGLYEFTTPALADGPHELSAVAVDQNGVILGTSQKVTINIDSTPPTIEQLDLLPGFTAIPGLSVQMKLRSEKHLQKVVLDQEGFFTELVEDPAQPGIYQGAFLAPATPGEYPLKFIVTDALNNQTTLTHTAKLVVTQGGAALKPVTDVQATPGNFRVSLKWKDATNASFSLKGYRIYYGTSPSSLEKYVDTQGVVTQWYVPNLSNSVTHYFGVVAVDTFGNLGEGVTLIIATPNDPKLINGMPSADGLSETPSVYGDTGPEVLWLIPLSLGVGAFLRRRR